MEAKNGTFSRSFFEPHNILHYSTLRYVDTIAHVCGFCFLFDHVSQNQDAVSEDVFTLTAIVYCLILSVLRISNSSIKLDRMDLTKPNFTSLFDICLWAVSIHKYRRTTHTARGEIRNRSSNIPKQFCNNEERPFCLEESLEETLMKISVDMFEKYNELRFITLKQNGLLFRCRIVSHFQALYYFRKGEYMKLLNTSDKIISHEIFTHEDRNNLKFLPDYRVQEQSLFCVSVLFAFQTFLKNDITCLTGIFELNRSVLPKKHVVEQYMSARVSCLFLVYFLRFQSLHQLHYPKSDILSVLDDLKHARVGLVFEDILLLFVGMTLKRLQR